MALAVGDEHPLGRHVEQHPVLRLGLPYLPGKDGYTMMDITQAVSQTLFT